MKNKNTNSFVSHLEDKNELLEEMEKQHEKQLQLQEETLTKMDKYQKSMIGVYAVIGFLLLGIILFWWNISRGQFYALFDKPFDNSAVEGLLYEIDKIKSTEPEINTTDSFDLGSLLENINSGDTTDLNEEEKAVLDKLINELNNGKTVGEAINSLKENLAE